MVMEITSTLLPDRREDLRSWLEKNHENEKEIWIIFFKKHSGKVTVSYDEAVEEALCFGWIDGILKRIDDEKHAIRFTPRRKGSIWSELNISRVKKMIEEGRMTEAGMKAFRELDPERIDPSIKIGKMNLELPDFVKKVFEEKGVLSKFLSLAPSHRKRYLFYITTAKKDDTRERRAYKVADMMLNDDDPAMR